MSPPDVHGNEMDGNFGFDDETTEEFLRGTARDVDPQLADVIGDMRVAYTSTPPAVGSELAAFIGATEPASVPQPRRFERMRSSIFAKIGAATAAVVAATGGLAVAGALPAPVQDAMSHIGVGAPSHHDKSGSGVEPGDETTTMVGSGETATEPGDDSTTPTTGTHGDDVNDVAHQHDGTHCDHAEAVANAASDGRSQHPDCATTPTSAGDPQGRDGSGDNNNDGDGGDHHGGGDNSNGTPPTTAANGGGDHGGDRGGQNGGDQNGGDQNGGSGHDSGSGDGG